MAGRLAELIVKIGADVSGFGKGVREVSAELDKMVNSTSGALRGFRSVSQQMSDVGTRLSLGLTLPLAGLGAAAVKADADMDSLMRGLVAVTGSAGAAEQQFARLEAVAKLPGLGFREAVQGAINLQAAGLSAELAERALKAFGNALATVGKGKADLDGVILALGQIQSKGKISAEEINQLAERVPQIRQAMKAAFGTADTEALSKMGISATQFVEKVTAEFEKLKQVTGGVKNGFENVQDAVQKSLAEIGKSLRPATEALLGFLEPAIAKTAEAAKGFKDLPPVIKFVTGALIAMGAAAPPGLAAIGQIGLGVSGLAAALPVVRNLTVAAAGSLAGWAAAAGGLPVVGQIVAGTLLTIAAGYYLYNREVDFATKDVEKNTGSMRAAAENLALSMRPTTADARRMADEFDNLAKKSGAAAAAHTSQAKALQELQGAMQGPKTLFQELSDYFDPQGKLLKGAEEYTQHIRNLLDGKTWNGGEIALALVPKIGDQVEQVGAVAQIVSKYWTDLWGEIANSQAAQRAEAGLRQVAVSLGINIDKYKELADAKKRLGLSDEKDLGQMAADVTTVAADPHTSDMAKNKALLEYLNEKRRQGVALTKEETETLRNLDKSASSAAKATVTVWTEIQQRLRAVFQDVSKNIVDLAFQGGKFKDVMVNALEEIGKGLARLALEKTLAGIGAQLGGIVSKIPGLAKIGGLLGIGGKTAETAGSAAASAAGAASSAASQAAGIASKAIGTSFTAMAGVVTGAISAVSGVIGNFQMAGMNKTLDLIEWNTRKTSLHAEHTLLKINEGIPGFGEVQQRISDVRDVLIGWDQYITGGVAFAGGGGVTINMAGSNFIGFRDLDAFLDELVRRMKQRGA